jgi:hypothetical protein
VDSTPRAYRLKASNACLSFSTFSGATPIIPQNLDTVDSITAFVERNQLVAEAA